MSFALSVRDMASRTLGAAPPQERRGTGVWQGGAAGVGSAKFLGDMDAADVRALSLLLDTNDDAARTVFDYRMWAVEWLGDLRGACFGLTEEEGGEGGGVEGVWEEALAAAADEIAAWGDAERNFEGSAADAQFANSLHQRTVLLSELLSQLRQRLIPGAFPLKTAPEPPKVTLGAFLQLFLLTLMRTTPPLLLLHLSAAALEAAGGGAGRKQEEERGGGGGAEAAEAEEAVRMAVLAAMACFWPQLQVVAGHGTKALEAGGGVEEVRSAVTLSGKVLVSRVSAQVGVGLGVGVGVGVMVGLRVRVGVGAERVRG